MRFWVVIAVGVVLFAASWGLRALIAPLPGAAPSGPAMPPPEGCHRIISMSPGLTESLFAVGAGDRVVGVTRFCNWPPEAKTRASIGGFLDPNYEAIVALHPDLVVLMTSHREHQKELERLGLRCAMVDQTLLTDILNSLDILGRLTGQTAQATKLRGAMEARIQAVQQQVSGLPRPRVLLSSGRDLKSSTLNEVYVVGRRTFLGDLLRLAGGENALPDEAIDYPALSAEAILRLNPDVIVEFTNGLDELGLTREQVLLPWRALPGLAAVVSGRIAALDGAQLTIPGPRVVDTLEALARAIHPELGGTVS